MGNDADGIPRLVEWIENMSMPMEPVDPQASAEARKRLGILYKTRKELP